MEEAGVEATNETVVKLMGDELWIDFDYICDFFDEWYVAYDYNFSNILKFLCK